MWNVEAFVGLICKWTRKRFKKKALNNIFKIVKCLSEKQKFFFIFQFKLNGYFYKVYSPKFKQTL